MLSTSSMRVRTAMGSIINVCSHDIFWPEKHVGPKHIYPSTISPIQMQFATFSFASNGEFSYGCTIGKKIKSTAKCWAAFTISSGWHCSL